MIYKKYSIRQGDTIQSIAQGMLGDETLWYDIASYNNLKYPYINRLDEPEYRVDNVAQIGDVITVPDSSTGIETVNSSLLNSNQRDEVSQLVLGRDLNIVSDVSEIQGRGTTDETVALSADNKGISIVSGYENLTQALLMRLNTPKGTLILHPEYGNSFSDILGLPNTQANVNKLVVMVEQTIRQDSRVTDVSVEATSVDSDTVTLQITITPIGFEEQLTIYLSTSNTSVDIIY